MRGGNPRRKGERGKFEGELFSVLHSCRSHLEGEAGPSEVLPWKLFCSPTGESCDVTWSCPATPTLLIIPIYQVYFTQCATPTLHHGDCSLTGTSCDITWSQSHCATPTSSQCVMPTSLSKFNVAHPPHPNVTPIPYVVFVLILPPSVPHSAWYMHTTYPTVPRPLSLGLLNGGEGVWEYHWEGSLTGGWALLRYWKTVLAGKVQLCSHVALFPGFSRFLFSGLRSV